MTETEALDSHAQGQACQGNGNHDAAIAAFEPAAAYFAAADGPNSPDLANVLVGWAESLLALCRFQAAEEKARRAKDIVTGIRDLLDSPSRGMLVPRALLVWGRSLRELGRYPDAAGPLLEALREAEEHLGPDHVETAACLNECGVLYKSWRRFDQSEGYYFRALRILEDHFGRQAPETAAVYHNLGGLAHSRGDFAAGEPCAHIAYEIRRAALGEDHKDTLADAVAWAVLLDGLERYSDSIPIYLRALNIYEQRFGPEHFEVAATLSNLGKARAAQGQLEDARTHLERAVAIKRKLFAPDHPEVYLTEANLQRVVTELSTAT